MHATRLSQQEIGSTIKDADV